MRAYFFATALSRRGHEVLLVTGEDPMAPPPRNSAARIKERVLRHDWRNPCVVAVPATPVWTADAARRIASMPPLRKALTAWNLVAHGGPYPGWTGAVKHAAKDVVAAFTPDLVWTTFGNTSNAVLAQDIARMTGKPWVLDIKDNWEVFVPAMLRRYMADRLRDAAALTANSEYHMVIARRWHRQALRQVVYSGVADELFGAAHENSPTPGPFLLLIGGTYSDRNLRDYLGAIRSWLLGLGPLERSLFRFRYAGADSSRVRDAIRSVGLEHCSTVDGYLPLGEMSRLARRAFACSYLWGPTFHHKLLELLVVGRHVIAFPGEHAESRRLAQGTDTPFRVCETQDTLVKALQFAWANRSASENVRRRDPRWRWSDFAVDLENTFERVLS